MQSSDFSETQFVIGFLREYINSRDRGFWLWNLLRVPSTVRERLTGADFITERVQGSDFFQFKRSDYLANRRGLPEGQRRVEKDFFDCYRFKVYNSTRTRQFDTLRHLARDSRNYCAYIAPLFHQFEEFDRYFSGMEIMRNSVEIDCSQFNRGEFSRFRYRRNDVHHLLFNSRDRHCWFCSEPKKAVANSASNLLQRPIGESVSFESHLNDILTLLKDYGYPVNRYLDSGINQKINIIRETLYREANIFWLPKFVRGARI